MVAVLLPCARARVRSLLRLAEGTEPPDHLAATRYRRLCIPGARGALGFARRPRPRPPTPATTSRIFFSPDQVLWRSLKTRNVEP